MKWSWGPVDTEKVKRAKKVKLHSIDADKNEGQAIGSSGELYDVTLQTCTCKIFAIDMQKGKPAPCKHIVKLAMELGILDNEGQTADEKELRDFDALEQRLMKCAWYFWQRGERIISDDEYDDLMGQYVVKARALGLSLDGLSNVRIENWEKIEETSNRLYRYLLAYYADCPIISDDEYDELKDQYKALTGHDWTNPDRLYGIDENAPVSAAVKRDGKTNGAIYQFGSIDSLKRELDRLHIDYIDKRENGGHLWVVASEEDDPYLVRVRVNEHSLTKAKASKVYVN